MGWVIADLVLAGLFIGFATGASPTPTGGNVATAVVAFLVGAIGAVASAGNLSAEQYVPVAQMLFLFLISFISSYVLTNVLRKHGKLEWVGFRGPGGKK